MPILFIASNLIFLFLLIKASIKGDSDQRFILKIIVCFHYVFLAFWAISIKGIQTNQFWLIIGLVFAFLGDAALGLKHKGSWALKAGLLFFMLTQISYIVFFGITAISLSVVIPFMLVLGLVAYRLKDNKAYDFKRMGIAVLGYAGLMTLMLSGALSRMIMIGSEGSVISSIGAVCFVISDITLMQLYFRQSKKTGMIPVYLICYHVAQDLMALSLWYK